MKGYKGFDKDFKCLDFQYEEGEVYEDDEAIMCEKGFHFCENPLDVLDYYSLIDNEGNMNQFAEVESLDDKSLLKEECGNIKYCTKKIKIVSKFSLKDFTRVSFEYIEKNSKHKITDYMISDYEYRSKIAVTYAYKDISISGNHSQVAIGGFGSRIAACGFGSRVVAFGENHYISISGNDSQVATSGNMNQIAASGDYCQIVTGGNCDHVSISGFNSIAVVSGKASSVVACGNLNRVVLNGKKSIGTNIGVHGIIKGKKGCWITLAEYDDNYNIKCVKSKKIDGKNLKEDTWYTLKNGKFVEVESWIKFQESITLHIRKEKK